MKRFRTAKTALVLALIAAVLAYTAAIIGYVRGGRFDGTAIGGGTFALALAFSSWRRMKSAEVKSEDAKDGPPPIG